LVSNKLSSKLSFFVFSFILFLADKLLSYYLWGTVYYNSVVLQDSRVTIAGNSVLYISK
jgi:hypothetical protein